MRSARVLVARWTEGKREVSKMRPVSHPSKNKFWNSKQEVREPKPLKGRVIFAIISWKSQITSWRTA